jgi:hypothetical protein
MTAPIDLADLERLEREATPAPWLNGERILPEDNCIALQAEEHADIYRVTEDGNCNVACATFQPSDAQFIVVLRNAFPAIRDEIHRLRARNLALYKSLRLVAIDECDGVGTCSRCDGHWTYGTAEQHAAGCLAAPGGASE